MEFEVVKVKIAQISATFPPYMAGTGNVCYQYALGLAKLGHEVTVYTSKCPDIDYKYPDSIQVVSNEPLLKIGNAPIIPDLVKIKGHDIVHLHYPFFFGGELLYLNSKLSKEKYIVTYHNDVISSGLLGYLMKIHGKTIMQKIISNSLKICVTSIDYAEHSLIRDIVNTRESDVIEIPNGVDPEKFNPNNNGDDVKRKLNIGTSTVILFVGALDKAHYFKGVDVLLKSFKNIIASNDDVRLLLVGSGDLTDRYINLAKELNVFDKTVFAGFVPDEELPKYYAIADMVVLPSVTMGEAFGLVLIEAMATGKPVIASNLPGVRTVVDNNFNGLLVQPENVDDLTAKLLHLLDNIEVRNKFGEAGRKKVLRRYSWETIAKKLDVLYKSVVE